MKIAILTTYFFPEDNGLTQYLEGIYGALAQAHPEFEIEILTLDTLQTKVAVEKRGIFKIRRVESWQFLGGTYAVPTWRGFKQLSQLFAEQKYAVINTQTRFFATSFLGIWFGKKYQIPVLHMEHGSGLVQSGSWWVDLLARLYDCTLGKYTLRQATLVCGTSQSVCDFAKLMGAKQAELIYNGLDLAFWKTQKNDFQIREKFALEKVELTVVFVGRLVPSKGCQDLILALAGLQEIVWKLLIVGDGFFKQNLEALVKKHGLEKQVLFLGWRGQLEVREILQNANLFVNPSFASESGPRTLLEALGSGCRCLSTKMGLASEILASEAIFEPRDVLELRQKIQTYASLETPKIENFAWEKNAEKLSQALLSLR